MLVDLQVASIAIDERHTDRRGLIQSLDLVTALAGKSFVARHVRLRLADLGHIGEHEDDAVDAVVEILVRQDPQHMTFFAVLDGQFLLRRLPCRQHVLAKLFKLPVIRSRDDVGE